MHCLSLISATGLLAASAVQAAPRAMSFDASHANQYDGSHAYVVDEEHSVPQVVPRAMQWAQDQEAQDASACPAPVLVVTTTTVDVTVYVTPEPTTEEPCPEDEMTSTMSVNNTITMTTTPAMTEDEPRVTISIKNMTVPEPCDDDDTMVTATQTSTMRHSQKVNMTMPASPSTSAMSTNTTSPTNSRVTISIIPDEHTTSTESTTSTAPTTTSTTSSRVTISIIPEHTTTSAPEMPTETPEIPECDEGSTFSFFNTTAAPTQAPEPTSRVIDTAVTPVSTSTMTASRVTVSIRPTKTQCVHDEPTGKPSDGTMYCGIHGKPAGTYFIAEFIENKPGEAVTEEGCYQFCDSVMESTKGCESYRFYKNNLGAPRCSLYGRGVPQSVDELDKNQPDVWYDLSCGSPMAEKWHEGMPADHGKSKRAVGGKKARRFFF